MKNQQIIVESSDLVISQNKIFHRWTFKVNVQTLSRTNIRVYNHTQHIYFNTTILILQHLQRRKQDRLSPCSRGKTGERKREIETKEERVERPYNLSGSSARSGRRFSHRRAPVEQFTFVVWPGATIYRRLACFPSAPCVEEYTRELKY